MSLSTLASWRGANHRGRHIKDNGDGTCVEETEPQGKGHDLNMGESQIPMVPRLIPNTRQSVLYKIKLLPSISSKNRKICDTTID